MVDSLDPLATTYYNFKILFVVMREPFTILSLEYYFKGNEKLYFKKKMKKV